MAALGLPSANCLTVYRFDMCICLRDIDRPLPDGREDHVGVPSDVFNAPMAGTVEEVNKGEDKSGDKIKSHSAEIPMKAMSEERLTTRGAIRGKLLISVYRFILIDLQIMF